jgi:very-short-patch-repair endonuclease
LAELAARQWGVVSVAQLDGLGIGRMDRTRWIDERRLHRVYPGVYAVGHPGLGLEGRLAAALFYAGPGAALYGQTGASWFEILETATEVVHVCTPRQLQSIEGLLIHSRRGIEPVLHNRLPVTPPAQVLLDIAAEVPEEITFKELRRALSEAEYQRLVTLDEVEAVLGRGKRGSATLRRALETHRPELARTKSALEELLVYLCEEYGFDQPEFNVEVAGWLVDAVWFEHKLVVELDSRRAHSTSFTQERDHQRDLDLRAAGFRVRRYTWQQMRYQPERVAGDLRRAQRHRTLLNGSRQV